MINCTYGDLELNGRSQPFSVTPDQGDPEYAKKILKPNGGTLHWAKAPCTHTYGVQHLPKAKGLHTTTVELSIASYMPVCWGTSTANCIAQSTGWSVSGCYAHHTSLDRENAPGFVRDVEGLQCFLECPYDRTKILERIIKTISGLIPYMYCRFCSSFY